MHDGLDPLSFPCQSPLTFMARKHNPAYAFSEAHHIVPLSWGGADVPANKINLCPNHHYAIHFVLDEYVKASKPMWHLYRWGNGVPPSTKRFDKATLTIAEEGRNGYVGADCPGLTL